MPEHSPLPWTRYPHDGTIRAYVGDAPKLSKLVASGASEADAAFIVRAVNCHEELVKQVTELLAMDVNIQLFFVRERLQAILAKAKGDK